MKLKRISRNEKGKKKYFKRVLIFLKRVLKQMQRKEFSTSASQTNPENYPPEDESFVSQTSENFPEISAKGPNLIGQYQKCIKNYIKQTDFARLSPYRSEIFECVLHRAQFQEKIAKESDDDVEKLPPSLFSGFNASLILTIDATAFLLVSTTPGIEITGDLHSEGWKMIQDISAGYLPSGLFEDMRKLSLTWYDGGVICEIVDKRRRKEKVSRVHLRVKASDIGMLTFEREQDYLLNRYPLLCLDPDLHVTDVARTIKADAERWIDPLAYEPKDSQEDNEVEEQKQEEFSQESLPVLLPPKESTEESREKLIKFLLQSKDQM